MYQANPLFQRTTKVSQSIPEPENIRYKDYSPEDDKLNWEWYNPNEKSVAVSFCRDTSLHGLKYLGQQKRHVFERFFWMAAFTASVVTAVILIWGMWSDFRNEPTITIFNPTELNLDVIPFPGVTICSVNSIQKTTIEKQQSTVLWHGVVESIKKLQGQNLSQEALKELALILDMNHICDSTLTFTDRFVGNVSILDWLEEAKDLIGNYSKQVEEYVDPIGTLQKVSQRCSKMILHCVWLEVVTNCDELFHAIETDYGYCCTFNTVPLSLLLKGLNDKRDKPSVVKDWNDTNLNYENLMFTKETENRKYPYRQRYPGRSAGLSFLLDPDLDEYFCTNTDSEGFILALNVPLDFPRMKDNGIAIQTNSEIFVGLKPEVTMSHDSIKTFPVEKRQCYYGNEYELPHYTKYTVSNCMNECIARKTVEHCECKRYYMPHNGSDGLCRPSQYNCTDDVRKTIISFGLSQACSECLPTCTEIEYQKEVTFLPLRKKKMEEMFQAFPDKFGTESYVERKVSIVHVYFSKESVHPKIRKEMTTVTELMSNAGGLLGLCLGFSALSLLEMLYYGSLRLCCNLYRNKTIRNRHEVNQVTELRNIEMRNNAINKRLRFQADNEYDGYEDNDGYLRSSNEVFSGATRSHNTHVYLPGSFEDQFQRAFLVAAYKEKL